MNTVFVYLKNSMADIRLIPLDHVTYLFEQYVKIQILNVVFYQFVVDFVPFPRSKHLDEIDCNMRGLYCRYYMVVLLVFKCYCIYHNNHHPNNFQLLHLSFCNCCSIVLLAIQLPVICLWLYIFLFHIRKLTITARYNVITM